jgi:hypothetical protein
MRSAGGAAGTPGALSGTAGIPGAGYGEDCCENLDNVSIYDKRLGVRR